MHSVLIFLALIGILGAAQPLHAAESSPVTVAIDPAVFVDDILTELMDEHELVGAGVALVYQGELVWSKGYGLADKQTGREFTVQTPSALHELAQLFTVVAVMQLVEAGQVDLDAPLQRYLPAFRPYAQGSVNSNNFTVRQLLTHHSGLPAYFAQGSGLEGYPADTSAHLYRQLLERSADIAMVGMPGEVFESSYLGYSLLGLLIETVSAVSYEQYMIEHIIAPLNLHHTHFVADPEAVSDIARAYVDDDPVAHKQLSDVPAAGLVASMQDMALFMQALFSDHHTLLSQASLDEIFRPQNSDVVLDQNFAIGLGFYTTPDTGGPFRNTTSASKASLVGVARSYILAFPQYQLALLLSTNTRLSSVTLRDTVDQIMERMLSSASSYTPDPFKPHASAPLTRDRAQAIAGAYGGPGGAYFMEPQKNSVKMGIPFFPFLSVNLLPRAEGFYGVELRFLGFIKLPGFGQLQLLANSVEGKVVQINKQKLLYWYWRGIAIVSLSEITPATQAQLQPWQEMLGDYRSEVTGQRYRFALDQDSGLPTFGLFEEGFKLFREPPSLYCMANAQELRSCSPGIVGTGNRMLLRKLPDGELLNAFGVRYRREP